MPSRGTRLVIQSVSKRFAGQAGRAAVSDVSLTVEPGELVTLLGPSGCGKTTTLRIVAGFEAPDAGRVWFGDQDVTHLEVYRRGIGFVFQSYALFPHLTVRENVAYGLRVQRIREAEVRERVARVLELVGLPGYEARFPNQLSGGEQQRVAVARAVVAEPRLLLFDEPLSNLDAQLRVAMRAELSRLQRELAITTVYVTHDQEEAMAISDRVAVMNAGRIAQIGTPLELYAAPRSAFVAQFIGRVNLLSARVVGSGELEIWGRRVRVAMDGSTPGNGHVDVVLRPESIGVVAEHAPLQPAMVEAPGIIAARTFLGEKVEYTVEVAGAALHAVSWDPVRAGLFDVGARVRVSCDPASLRPLAHEGG